MACLSLALDAALRRNLPRALWETGVAMPLRPAYPVLSPRLRVRPLSESDVPALLAYRSLPEVCRWVPFEPMDAQDIRRRLGGLWSRTTLEAEGEHLVLGIELARTGELIGDLFLLWQSETHRCVEIGYVINPAHGGQGYATEGAHLLLHLAFDELGAHRAVARVDARNCESARLLGRLGMRQEAHLIQNEWFKGAWSDELDFALLETEWAAQHADGCPFGR